MKVVIVEDEILAVEKLQRLLFEVDSEIKVIKILETVEDSVNWFAANASPDLIFMDIQLEDGISFEIFDEVKIDAPIIFTTAFDEYAIRAFKVNSVDYLLKPIELDKLKKSIEKFKTIFLERGNIENRISQVFKQISKPYKSRFFIKIGIRFQSIPVNEICSFFVEERNTFLQTQKGKKYDLDYSLEYIQKMIDPSYYFRINRNYLVNINCIEEMITYSSSRLKLRLRGEKSDDLIVSRDKISDFKKWMYR